MSKRSRSVGKVLVAAMALLLVMCAGGLIGMWQALQPNPVAADLQGRTPAKKAARTLPTRTSEAPSTTLVWSGEVVDVDGHPMEGVQLEWYGTQPGTDIQILGTTTADGRFSVQAPGPGSLSTERPTAPGLLVLEADAHDLRFTGLLSCPVTITVLHPDGTPAEGIEVAAEVAVEKRVIDVYERTTSDADGLARFPDLACGVAYFSPRSPHHVEDSGVTVDSMVEQAGVLQLDVGVRVFGSVTLADGTPVAEGRVYASGAEGDITDGTYTVRVRPDHLHHVVATDFSDGRAEATVDLPAGDPPAELQVDLSLDTPRKVRIHCAGMPDDDCSGTVPLECTETWAPYGASCVNGSCACPEGEAAIRGAGVAVAVEPHDTHVWIDLRDRATLVGTVTVDGVPAPRVTDVCGVQAIRVSEGVAEWASGPPMVTSAACAPDGSFELSALLPGDYVVSVSHSLSGPGGMAALGNMGHTLPPVHVDGERVDIGTIDLSKPVGVIEGVVIDGLTDEGAVYQEVFAYQGSILRPTQFGHTLTRSGGAFTLSGYADGPVTVGLLRRPLQTITVQVVDGSATGIELITVDTEVMDEAGFEVESLDDGLVVTAVEAGGPADGMGLVEGDRVVGVVVAGVDLTDVVGTHPDAIARAMEWLHGPGATLIIDRDGTLLEVPFDG